MSNAEYQMSKCSVTLANVIGPSAFKIQSVNNMNKVIPFASLFILLNLFSCTKSNHLTEESIPDLRGCWYLITNDTTYNEAIYTYKNVWGYSDAGGVIFRKYIIKGDSLIFSSLGNGYPFPSKLEVISKDEFLLKNLHFTSHYFRLDLPLDTAKILNDEEDEVSDFIEGMFKRRDKWYSTRH